MSQSVRPVIDYGLTPSAGACPTCGCIEGRYSEVIEVVVCGDCGTPWPSSYWSEQS